MQDYDIWISSGNSPFETEEIETLANHFRFRGYRVLNFKLGDIDTFISPSSPAFFYKNERITVPKLILSKDQGMPYPTFNLLYQCEALGTVLVNSAAATELTRNKPRCAQVLMQNGIPTPEMITLQLNQNNSVDLVEEMVGFPCVLKIVIGAHGRGVTLCKNRFEFEQLVGYTQSFWPPQTNNVIVQKFVASSQGKDVRVIVVGDQVVGGMKRIAKPGDFRSNISANGHGESFLLSQETKDLCLKITKVLDLKVAGIDLLFDDQGGFTVCEINATPGFSGFERFVNDRISNIIADYCHDLITGHN